MPSIVRTTYGPALPGISTSRQKSVNQENVRRLSLQKSHLLRGPGRHEDTQVVRSRIGGMHEKAVAFTAVAECRSEQDLAVVEGDGHLAALRRQAELLAIDAHLIAGEVAHEEQRLQLREMQEQRVVRMRSSREMQLRFGRVEVGRVATHQAPVAKTRDDLLPGRCSRPRPGPRKSADWRGSSPRDQGILGT